MTHVPHDWPHRAASIRARCLPHDWHAQIWGHGPHVLLLHGAGASAHSFHPLVPYLPGFRLIAPDLPGQGFTRIGNRQRFGLDAMAEDLAALCRHQNWRPRAIIGHSAGAAVALRLAEILPVPPTCVVGINAALGPFEGVEGWLFPKLAKVMAFSPLVGRMISGIASNPARVAKLIAQTGSTPDSRQVALYAKLVARPAHVEATLGMMAHWSLDGLLARLPAMTLPLLLLAGARDVAVPPAVSHKVAARKPGALCIDLPGLGHLAHEEAPETIAALILPFLAEHLGAVQAAAPVGSASA
ncbi:MAG: alpha/beta fold hydrolase BchO [Pararhodobacter sp.]